ncbi:MAG: hypothetical protein ACLRZ7_04240 [Lachnospiraceae bacterium]
MVKYKEQSPTEMEAVICNRCGKVITVLNGIAMGDYLSVKKTWGYFSEKDEECHSFDLCENCYDELIQGFVIPVQIEDENELL